MPDAVLPAGQNAAPSVQTLESGSEQHFEIDQRRGAVDGAAHFAKAAFAVEIARAGTRVPGIEADGVGGPGSSDATRLFEATAADSFALVTRIDRHRGEVERFLAGVEIFPVDGPGLAGGKREHGDDAAAEFGDVNGAAAHGEERAFFREARGPIALAVLAGQVAVDGGAEEDQAGDIALGGGLEGKGHGG